MRAFEHVLLMLPILGCIINSVYIQGLIITGCVVVVQRMSICLNYLYFNLSSTTLPLYYNKVTSRGAAEKR